MRTLGSLLTLSIFALAMSCGDSKGGGGTGGSGGQGGNIGIDGGGGSGGAIDGPVTGGVDGPVTGEIDAPVTAGIDGPVTGGIDAPVTGGIDAAPAEAGIEACNLPACVASVFTTCQPAGTCVKQQDLATLSSASCFSNGIKIVQGLDAVTRQSIVTYKNGAATCYSVVITLGSPISFAINDAAGVALGTGTVDVATNAMSFTCTNSAPVVLNSACNVATIVNASGASAACTDGVCAP
jgi:hypothetical protein